MTTPALYHVVMEPDGKICVLVEDGPYVAEGESEIRQLSHICDLALCEIKRRKDAERLRS
jgi:hypothetical protein